jgi:pyrimidine operon attenuation protein / uracil phosphoribosyltransferase
VNVMAPVQILDGSELRRTVRRLAHEILEAHSDAGKVVVVGIREGGVSVARAVADAVFAISNQHPGAVADVDVSAFRDDRPRTSGSNAIQFQTGDVSLDDFVVILVDDVIQTGRTLRAALDAVTSAGRPRAIESLVLIDRGQREVPLRPNYVGKNIPASHDDWVKVRFNPQDESGAYLVKR